MLHKASFKVEISAHKSKGPNQSTKNQHTPHPKCQSEAIVISVDKNECHSNTLLQTLLLILMLLISKE